MKIELGKHSSKTLLRVRYGETDQMRIAHHSSYVAWLELARIEWLRERSFRYAELEASGIALGVAGMHIRYLHPAHFDDLISVWSSLVDLKSRYLAFRYVIRGEDGCEIATASTDHVPIDRSGKVARLATSWQELLADYLETG